MIMTPYISNSNRNIPAVYTLMYIFYGVVVMILTFLMSKNIARKKCSSWGINMNKIELKSIDFSIGKMKS